MILSDADIKNELAKTDLNSLKIREIVDSQIQPASVDVRLGSSFITATGKRLELPELILAPKEFILGTTEEYIQLPTYLTAFVEGRSSWGRMGLFIQNAGWVDPGFEGEITLELFNASDVPIKLEAGTRIAQLVFAKVITPAENPYDGFYQRQRGATQSKFSLEV